MSILIKGIEMPTRCEDCFCYRHNAEYDYAYCNISSVNVLGNANARLNNCPLVPVPPHGRLIDADALIDAIIAKYIRHERNRELVFAAAEIKQDLADIINELPTIIPASEEGE